VTLQLKIRDLSAVRHWLRTDELFSSDSNVKEALTAEGQREIDGTIECSGSMLAEQCPRRRGIFRCKVRRASGSSEQSSGPLWSGAISTKRFSLQPNMVAVMPMSDSPPPGVGKSVFDGVSLVLTRQ
jgi:hypothetical protein